MRVWRWVGRGEREVPAPGRQRRRATATARTDTSSCRSRDDTRSAEWLWARWGGAKKIPHGPASALPSPDPSALHPRPRLSHWASF